MSIRVMTQVWATSRQKGSALLLLLAIADHAHDDGGGAYPSVASLAEKTRMSERQTRTLIGTLEASGELAVERNGGPGGVNLYVVLTSSGVQTSHLLPAIQRRTPAVDRTTPLKPTAPVTVTEPSLESSKNLTRVPRAATPKQIEREQHIFGKEAEKVWETAARKRGNPYIDRGSLRAVHQQAIESTRWADEQLVLTAIRERMDEKSSPRRIPEWARLHESDRREEEHNALQAAEKAERNTIVEHQGTKYIGHVPDVVGDNCRICKRSLKDHVLASVSQLRPLSGAVGKVLEDARSRVSA